MKIRRIYVILGVISLIITGIFAFFLSGGNNPEITPFNAKPDAFGSGLYNSADKIPPQKLTRVYQTKVIVHGRYSPEKHLAKHPEDVAIRTSSYGEDVVVILTNDNPKKNDYFVE